MINAILAAGEQTKLGSFDLFETLIVAVVMLWLLLRTSRDAALAPLAEVTFLKRVSLTPLRLYGTVVAAALLLRGVMLPVMPPPMAIIPDDYSLLLQAQTFMAGRLANPPHPLGAFFETMYVNQVPAYASMYFPGRSLPLLGGLWLAGDPWVGVWLVMIALAVATTWMLRAWVTPSLALVGGLLVVVRYGVFSYWINSYYGGTLTALGGVLLMGSFERLRHRIDLGNASLLALGVLLLMLTRPFEGLLFALPFGVVLLLRLVGAAAPMTWPARASLTLPALVAIGGGAALLLAHNLATTGSPLTTPYEINRQAYAISPVFWTGEPLVPHRPVPAYLHNYYWLEGWPYRRLEEPFGVAQIIVSKLLTITLFFIGPAMLMPFLTGLAAWRRFRVPAAGTALLLAGFAMTVWDWAHYVAPAFGFFVMVIVIGLDRMGDFRWRGRPVGASLSRVLPIIVVAMLLVPITATAVEQPFRYSATRVCCIIEPTLTRLTVELDRRPFERRLTAEPGRHLVLVTEDANDSTWVTWVINPPDIDAAPIIWANDLGPERDKALLAHYPDRRVWTVHLRAFVPPRLVERPRPDAGR